MCGNTARSERRGSYASPIQAPSRSSAQVRVGSGAGPRGAPGALAGAVPGLVISGIGGAAGTAGQAAQDHANGVGTPLTVGRALAGIFGGRAIRGMINGPKALRSGDFLNKNEQNVVDTLLDELFSQAYGDGTVFDPKEGC